jgi:hypothetical protein
MHTIIKDLSYNAKNKDTKPVPRIWLDAKELKPFGIKKGDRFDRIISNGIVIIRFNSEGKRKVSGNDKRPVIDINGAFLEPFFQGATQYKATFIKANETQYSNTNDITIQKVA